jgi:FkbM family methyltransferase
MEIRDLLGLQREVLEGFCEKRATYAYLGKGQGMCRILGKHLLYVDPQDVSLAPHLMLKGHWEIWINQALSRIPPGRVKNAADVGANVGYYAVLMADLFTGARVHAFEPQDDLAQLISKSADVNGFRNSITVYSEAVGAHTGTVWTQRAHGAADSRGSVYCTEVSKAGTHMEALDSRVIEPLDFVKIDVEGFEPLVWAGMKRHLENKPIILMEFTPQAYPDAKGFLREIASCYPLREVDTGGSVVPIEEAEVLDTEGFRMLWLEA